ncbi:MAG: hypothetical protein JNK82_32940 [Myxococcaceae bacterium]|nr:hypothetical protein [Myxococcaceae bacterium]
MKMGLALVVGVLVAAFALAGFVLPKHVTVGRRIVIDAPSELVWADLGSPATWAEWAEGPAPQVTESDPHKGLKFKRDLDGTHQFEGRVQLTKDGTRTAVAWVDNIYFAHDYAGRYRGAAMNVTHGPSIEKSLLALKTRAEDRAKAKHIVAVPAPQVHDPALTPPPDEPKGPTPPAPVEPPPAPVEPPPAQPAPKPVEAPPPAPSPAPAAAPAPVEPPKPVEAPPPAEPPAEKPAEPPAEKPAEDTGS